MRVADVMTTDVESLDPGSTLLEAAKRMRDLDVGAIPVTREGKPMGMLTDRDIAVRAVAEGHDIRTATVGDLMTESVVAARASDNVESAAEVMQQHQVRRLMVIDDEGMLCGIVSLGDLSLRTGDEELAETTLEDVSWPGRGEHSGRLAGLAGGGARSHRATHASAAAGGAAAAGTALAMVSGVLLGAGLMYLFDPLGGRRRRAVTRDKLASYSHRATERLGKKARHARNMAQGVVAETKSALHSAVEGVTGGAKGTGGEGEGEAQERGYGDTIR